MKKNIIYILLIMVLSLFACLSCQNNEDARADVEDDEPKVRAIVPDMILEDEDIFVTRSALVYQKPNMMFSWESSDQIGVFNIGIDAVPGGNVPFYFKRVDSYNENSTTARFINGNFSFSDDTYWAACSPRACVYTVSESNGGATISSKSLASEYDVINLTYRGQTQVANAHPEGLKPVSGTVGYSYETEAKASSHLGAYDYLISQPTVPDETGFTTFYFDHVGSTIRFYVLFPEGSFGGSGKKGYVTSMKVIDEDADFVTDVTLGIKKRLRSETVNTAEKSYEVIGEPTKVNNITMYLKAEDGGGVMVPDHGYFVTYMQVYPTSVAEGKCHLEFTVMVDGVKRYFRSQPLPAKTFEAGHVHMWQTQSFDTPIELTATLLPWEDIQGGSISTGEE
ncbi:MAG: hypothetical protein KBT06_10620 [Prevotellaceae bacterium]|nr:hypothetical protein [Candidatus Colivivens equi]